jgi:transcriptional regulator with XRE-family HTH domain
MHMNKNKLRKYRELRNYSQEYLADQLGISQNAYSKVESSQTKLTVSRLKMIASILEVSEEDLLNPLSDAIISLQDYKYQSESKKSNALDQLEYEKMIAQLNDEIQLHKKEKAALFEIIQLLKTCMINVDEKDIVASAGIEPTSRV